MITFNIHHGALNLVVFEHLMETRRPISIKDTRDELYFCYVRGIQNGWLLLDRGGEETFRKRILDIVRVNVV